MHENCAVAIIEGSMCISTYIQKALWGATLSLSHKHENESSKQALQRSLPPLHFINVLPWSKWDRNVTLWQSGYTSFWTYRNKGHEVTMTMLQKERQYVDIMIGTLLQPKTNVYAIFPNQINECSEWARVLPYINTCTRISQTKCMRSKGAMQLWFCRLTLWKRLSTKNVKSLTNLSSLCPYIALKFLTDCFVRWKIRRPVFLPCHLDFDACAKRCADAIYGFLTDLVPAHSRKEAQESWSSLLRRCTHKNPQFLRCKSNAKVIVNSIVMQKIIYLLSGLQSYLISVRRDSGLGWSCSSKKRKK